MNASKLYYIITHYIYDADNDYTAGYIATYIDIKNGYDHTYRTCRDHTITTNEIKQLATDKTKKQIDDFFSNF